MKIEIKVPAMGESISEAVIGELLKPSGSVVAVNDEIIELETDKVNQVLYAQQPGIINWNVQKGDQVRIGQVIGSIDPAAAASTGKTVAEEKTKLEEPPPPIKPSRQPDGSMGIRLTKEAYLSEIQTAIPPVTPSSAAASPSPAPPEFTPEQPRETRRKMSKIRQVIGKRLVEAQQSAAMLTTFNEVDMSRVIALRETYRESFAKEYGVRLGFLSFFVKAAVAALKYYPEVNAYIDGAEIVERNYYDLGIAVSTERGLMVPVIRNCDLLSFAEIEKAIETYAKKAKEGSIAIEDLQGGGFTITNGGVYGSLLSTPILNPPQPAILGMHKIGKRAVVVDDAIVIRPMMYLALSYDHRMIDGREAVGFLIKIKEQIEEPSRLLLGA